jgi:hypothetical protein
MINGGRKLRLQQKDWITQRWRKVKQPEPLEDEIQKTLIKHWRLFRRPGVMCFHIPNGGYRHKVTGVWLKAMGVQPGVADLQFIWTTLDRTWVLFLELKAHGRKQTPEQRLFETECGEVGASYETADSIDAALAILNKYGLLRGSIT